MHASAKTRASEAQEVLLGNRFEHLADDGGELPIQMTSEESVPRTVEPKQTRQQCVRPTSQASEKSEGTEKSIVPLRHTAWVTLCSLACSS